MGIFHNLGSPVCYRVWFRSETVSCSAGEGYRNTELEEQSGKSKLRYFDNQMKAAVGEDRCSVPANSDVRDHCRCEAADLKEQICSDCLVGSNSAGTDVGCPEQELLRVLHVTTTVAGADLDGKNRWTELCT